MRSFVGRHVLVVADPAQRGPGDGVGVVDLQHEFDTKPYKL
jgi:hypothetical protein